MKKYTVYTIDARGHVALEVYKSYFNADSAQMNTVILKSFLDMKRILTKKGIEYDSLKNALIPRIERKEIAFIFDTTKISDIYYGLPIYKRILPLLNKKSSCSVLVGDCAFPDHAQHAFRYLFFKRIVSSPNIKNIKYQNSGQFFTVYLNNMTDEILKAFVTNLESFAPYVGYFDLTYTSQIKTFLSVVLVKMFVQCKNKILLPDEEGANEDVDVNNPGIPWEEYGFNYKSIDGLMYGIFLSYKIERPVVEGFKSDTEFAMNAITPLPKPIDSLKIKVSKEKFDYFAAKKSHIITKTKFSDFSMLEKAIKQKINDNYIFNMNYNEEFELYKFNIVIEEKGCRFIASLKLDIEKNALSIITIT